MSEVISIVSQKGGVGKTTTAVNLSASLAQQGKKVLLLDMDPQSNATISLGFTRGDYEFNIYNVLRGMKKMSQVMLKTDIKNLKLIPSNIGLVGIEKDFYNPKNKNKESMLKSKVKKVSSMFDFIIIDSPPGLGPITINVISASDSLIVPVQCEFFALEGLSQLISNIRILQKSINPALKIKGFIPTMYSSQNNLSKQVLDDLLHHFKDNLFYMNEKQECIVIPRNVKVAESPSFGQSVIDYASTSKGSIAYQNLAKVIIEGRKNEI